MSLRIEDLVETAGVEAIVTNIFPDGQVLCQPVGKGLPIKTTQDKILVKYSFLSELETLATDEELQNLLKQNEDLLARMNTGRKVKKVKTPSLTEVSVETEGI